MADTPAPSAAAPANGERECSGGFQLTPLMKAAIHGDVSLVEKALECTALNLDAVGGDGRTALHTAAANEYMSCRREFARNEEARSAVGGRWRRLQASNLNTKIS